MLGVDLTLRGVDWPAVRDRGLGRIGPPRGGGDRYRATGRDNVALYRGTARFTGERQLGVDTADGPVTITADQVVVAVGSRPDIPDVPGLDHALGDPPATR